MNSTPFFVSFIFSILFFALVGCRTAEKAQTTDWSLPSVKLIPTAKDEKVVAPADKANASATASLARDRLNGHNPSATIRDSADETLRPNPEEMAQLHRFENNVLHWATENGLPPGPEASKTTPSERVAQNVNESTLNSVQNHETEIPASIQLETPQVAVTPPALDSNSKINSSVNTEVPNVPNGETWQNTMVAQELPSAGNTMLELPGTASPASAVQPPTVNYAAANTSAASVTTPVPNQPAVLFMPGNINPQYPNSTARQ